jgi:ribonuclease R
VREREAAQIEYLADEIALAWLLNDELFERGWDEPFEGEIIGIIGSGLFVRFGDVFEGYLPARRLPGDYFEPTPLGTSMAGRRGSATYRLGDPIMVRVVKIDRNEGKVELEPAPTPQSDRNARGGGEAARAPTSSNRRGASSAKGRAARGRK